jgi:hypothetical protein
MWLMPFAALLCGAGLGLVVDITGASPRDWYFVAGAILAGCWLLGAPLLLCRGVAHAWCPIASRIFGSWLIAIGAMLAALVLIRF